MPFTRAFSPTVGTVGTPRDPHWHAIGTADDALVVAIKLALDEGDDARALALIEVRRSTKRATVAVLADARRKT